ncbi:hypothetical protein DFH09DRAFT_1432646 [Mycena vulgaris]|nr:hypothetical protein DFH09DRAFT_1432646 [Mycena vulgaris]
MDGCSAPQLEHAATSPARFIAHLSKVIPVDDFIPAFSTRIFQPRLPKASPADSLLGQVSPMRLIPGGRYLVTSSDTARVSVWDLGFSPATVISPYPLVSIVLSEAPAEFLIQPTKDHKGFRLVVFYTLSNTLVEVMVFEFYPARPKPTFICIAKRRNLNSLELKATALTQDIFTYHHELLVTIWNFVEDASATVHVYQPLLDITVSSTTIIGQLAEGIVIIEIPPLHPSGTPAAEAVVEPVTPLMMLSHIHAVFGSVTGLYPSQSDWNSSPDIPPVFDVFGILVDGSYAYARCLVKPVAGDPDLPSTLPVFMGVSRVPGYESDFYGRMHFAGTHLVRTWPTSDSLMVNVAKIPARRQIEFESKSGGCGTCRRVFSSPQKFCSARIPSTNFCRPRPSVGSILGTTFGHGASVFSSSSAANTFVRRRFSNIDLMRLAASWYTVLRNLARAVWNLLVVSVIQLALVKAGLWCSEPQFTTT